MFKSIAFYLTLIPIIPHGDNPFPTSPKLKKAKLANFTAVC